MSTHTTATTASALAQAEKYCAIRGTRLTKKRRHVLEGLLDSKRALSAYELADYCRDELGHSFPAMSVYRILDFLEEEKLVHRLNLAKKYVACSHIACEHEHEQPQFLICKQCDRVQEIAIERSLIGSLNKSIKDSGYALVSEQLEIDCLCEDCHGK